MEVPSERKKEIIEHEAVEEESIYLLKDRANIACDGGNYAEARELFELLIASMISYLVWKKRAYYHSKEKRKKLWLPYGQSKNEVVKYSESIQVGKNIPTFEI